MKEVTFEGNRLRSTVRMGWSVHRCRSFLPAQGLALGTVHLDVLPCQARPGQVSRQVGSGAGPAGAVARCQVHEEKPVSAGPFGHHHPHCVVSDFVLDCQGICRLAFQMAKGKKPHPPRGLG